MVEIHVRSIDLVGVESAHSAIEVKDSQIKPEAPNVITWLFAAGDVSRGPSGEERGETDVFAGYYFRFALKITLRRAWRNEKRA